MSLVRSVLRLSSHTGLILFYLGSDSDLSFVNKEVAFVSRIYDTLLIYKNAKL